MLALIKKGVSTNEIARQTGVQRNLVHDRKVAYAKYIGAPDVHSYQKGKSLKRWLDRLREETNKPIRYLELFGELGRTRRPGVCSRVYRIYGDGVSLWTKDGDALTNMYVLVGTAPKSFDVVDIDGYGPPSLYLQAGVTGLVRDGGLIIMTIPSLSNVRRWPRTRTMSKAMFNTANPSLSDVLKHAYRAAGVYGTSLHAVDDSVVRCGKVLRVALKVRHLVWSGKACAEAGKVLMETLMHAQEKTDELAGTGCSEENHRDDDAVRALSG